MNYRLPTTQLTLPFSFEDIKFPVNRIADNATFNSKIEMVGKNFDALLNYCNVVDNRLPYKYEHVFSLDDNTVYELSSFPATSDHNYKFIEAIGKQNGRTLVICATETKIDFFASDIITPENLDSISTYDKIKDRGNLSFKNISYIKCNDNKLYVYDNVYENIYVYNLISFLTSDEAISNVKFLKHFFKIKGLKAFGFDNNKIYGITNNTLKLYNQDFNRLSEINLSRELPIDIVVEKNIFILYNNEIHVYDKNDLSFIRSFRFISISNDTFLNIKNSKIDLDILYILSNNYIYKYNINGQLIGYFNVSTNKKFRHLSVIQKDDEDFILGLDENKINLFRDKIVSFKLYDEVNLLDRESLSELRINDLELEQDFVYNSVLQKIIFNTFLLYNSLIYKAFIETDQNGILTFQYIENLVFSESLERANIFYGQNEVFSYQTFNRAFKEIFDIQTKILKLIEFGVVENTTNTLII